MSDKLKEKTQDSYLMEELNIDKEELKKLIERKE